MARKVQLQTNGKEWQVIDGEQVLVDVEKQDIDPITSSSCVQIEGFRTLEEAVSDNKMLSQDLTYTKVMDKVGGDYHQNVLDGQYSKAILYGNTQVNLCEEDTSVALQIPTTFTSFNNGELQIKNKESQVVAPLIKGVTMVNLAQTTSSSITSGNGLPIHNVKGNTLYTLSFKFTTKNTNSGVVIQCYDVNGEYLENTMHKTGLGDDVKFTFTTHANATKIHICNNAAYGGETIQLDDIMLIEGDQTALDIPFFKGMKSVELVRPLTNLFTNDTSINTHNATVTNSNGTVTVTSTHSSAWSAGSILLNTSLKPNTKYLVMWDNLEYTQTSTGYLNEIIGVYVTNGNTKISYINNDLLCPTKRSLIFDTKSYQLDRICLRIHATISNTETGTTTVTGLRVFEYDDYLRSVDLQSIGWFSGTKNVAVEPIKTCSKNLYPYGDISFTPTSTGWFDAKGNSQMTGDIASKSHSRFLLKKGTYYFSIGSNTNAFCQLTDDKENMGVNANSSFTLQEDRYVTLRVKVTTANTSATVTNIQIERGETATAYVAYDSRYYEPDGQNAIVLRGLPNGVCDTFNLQTGEYVQRINEVIFDGSDDENWNAVTISPWTENGYYTFEYLVQTSGLPTYDANNGIYTICDKFNSITYNAARTDVTGVLLYDGQGKKVGIKQRECTTLDEWKQYLASNPITVQYQLATPITTIIPRTIKRNNNGTVSTIDFGTYTNKENLVLPKNPTFLTINSMTSIKPVVEPIAYFDFKTRLKANTDYSIIIDKDSANKTINLGGTSKTYTDKMLVRTPSIDLEQNLRISGNGSIQNIMVIEGDVLDKELPYFNGMCNVKMPIVRNCGKNLFDGELYINYGIQINGTTSGEPAIPGLGTITDWVTTKNHIPVKKGDIISIAIDANDSDITSHRRYTYVYKYDTRKQFIAHERYDLGVSTKTFTVAHNGYIRCTIKTHNVNNISITKENTPSMEQYRGNDICIAQGEIRLTPDMFEQGGFSGNQNSTYEESKANMAQRYRIKELFEVEPNTTYNIRYTEYDSAVFEYGVDKKKLTLAYNINKSTLTITTSASCHYLAFNFVTSTLPTQCISIIKVSEMVQLRSLPNGVKDELNLLTGEYIQRVGEVVFDGSEDENWQLNNTESTTTKRFIIGNLIGSNVTNDWNGANKYVCDKLNKYLWSDTVEFGITVIDNSAFLYNNNIDYSIGALKTWLSQNPITVQYELAEPIISYPRIVSNTQEREIGVKLPNGVCDTYNPSTGITVKRVGKVVLDGSEDWKEGGLSNDTYCEGWLPNSPFAKTMKPVTDISFINGNFVTMFVADGAIPYFNSLNSLIHGGINIKNISNPPDPGAISLIIQKSKMTTPTLDGFKQYLASNPITVWYELANPIVTTDIVLPNGVHDEYNPLTGLYTKRVGFIEFDGSEDEDWHEPFVVAANGAVDMYGTWTEQPLNNAKLAPTTDERIPGICDKLKFRNSTLDSANEEFYFISYTGRFNMNINRSKLSEPSEQSLKTYLSQNPIKVWYELATPITYQLTPYFGLPMPYAYKDGYLIMDSAYDGQTLPPEITYQLIVNRTGQITQNNIKLKEHTARLSNLEYILIEATLDSIFSREMQNFELELMNVELFNLDE